jgi:hypothetical protein
MNRKPGGLIDHQQIGIIEDNSGANTALPGV